MAMNYAGTSSGTGSRVEDHRRKWDRDEYEKLAKERLDQELEAQAEKERRRKEPVVKRELLKQRDYKVDLDSKLGKSQVITKTTPSSQMGGYYCDVCDCVVKDSINFLDHINGKKHQRNLGMSMNVERSSLDQVKKRFEMNKKKVEEKKKDYDFEARLQELKEEEEKHKAYQREKRKERKRRADDRGIDGMDPDMASMMGFAGFGSNKKKY
ncbi:zinc finger matrin-type protein 2-like [Lytechinus variegatus]|uniref:zinc finger matrin-type protein 2-like n=1 Tax=Lytechinus variegatus TaxID=7654 RepID=UPI001BB27B6F|nr:zinc finger matrin-type protein 2-like [Lytechinus variegatus]XP_041459548.1 zinc finger matrin-type protein 2-like [Lytechinus variegatus]